jgi:oligopeptide/dipeptide ABC transporter ATP-binding protein
MTRPLIEVDRLSKHFSIRQRSFFGRRRKTLRAVDDVSFSIERGDTLGLVGESGCGKTTTAMMLLRLEMPTSGQIRYEGSNLAQIRGPELRRYRAAVQAVLQDPWSSLSPRLKVGSIIAEPLLVHTDLDRTRRRDRVAALLQEVGLHPWQMDLYPHEFSGGQRQRICIARALSLQPRLIVLDEPVSALDVSVQAQVMNLLKEIQQRAGLSYLLISHNLGTVRYLCSHVAVMYLGQIVEIASAKTVLDHPLHPYTKALIAASRITRDDDATGAVPEEEMPSPTDMPPGCRFHTRCPAAMPHCRTVAPILREAGDGHRVSCHLYDGMR